MYFFTLLRLQNPYHGVWIAQTLIELDLQDDLCLCMHKDNPFHSHSSKYLLSSALCISVSFSATKSTFS